jgi:RNA polymerase sigma-70 factor, ECF subfamily
MDDIRPDSNVTQRLLDRVQSGSEEALGQLLKRHQPRIEAAVDCRLDRRLRARLDASDIVQETQLEAVQRMEEYLMHRPMPFRLWLMRAAHQRVLKAERRHLQTGKRAIEREAPLPDRSSLQIAARFARSAPSPGGRMVRQELARQVRRLMAQLSEGDREIIMLRNFEGLSNGESACLLEITPEAAKKRYARALLRLQSLLCDAGLSGAES